MNRVVLVGVFTAMKAMLENEDYDGLARTIECVLDEARTKPIVKQE